MAVDSSNNPNLAPISADLSLEQQAIALRNKLNAIQTSQGGVSVPDQALDAFLADNPEVKTDLKELDFNEKNPTTTAAVAALGEFLENLHPSIVIKKPSEGSSPSRMTKGAAIQAGYVVVKIVDGQTSYEPAPGFEWADTREDSDNYAVLVEGAIHDEGNFEAAVVKVNEGAGLSDAEKLAVDLEEMGYTDALWKEFLTNASTKGLPDRSGYELIDISTDKMYAKKVLELGKSPSEFAKRVKGLGGSKDQEIDWVEMAAPRYMKWHKVQKAQEGLRELRHKQDLRDGQFTDDTGRTVTFVESKKPEPVTVKLQRPPANPPAANSDPSLVASSASTAVADSGVGPERGPSAQAESAATRVEAAPEAPVNYQEDAREHPEKYLSEGVSDTSVFNSSNRKAELAIRIEDLYFKDTEKPNLSSTRYPGLIFRYGPGTDGNSWYDVAGSGKRLAILNGDTLKEVKVEPAAVAAAPELVPKPAPAPVEKSAEAIATERKALADSLMAKDGLRDRWVALTARQRDVALAKEKAVHAWLGKNEKLKKVDQDAAVLAKDYRTFQDDLGKLSRDDLTAHSDALAFYDAALDNEKHVLAWLSAEPFSQETQRLARGEAEKAPAVAAAPDPEVAAPPAAEAVLIGTTEGSPGVESPDKPMA